MSLAAQRLRLLVQHCINHTPQPEIVNSAGLHSFNSGGTAYARIPFGPAEIAQWSSLNEIRVEPYADCCGDCQVTPGQYHIFGCGQEICPVCSESSAMHCDCHYEGLPRMPFFVRPGDPGYDLYMKLREYWIPGTYEPIIDLLACSESARQSGKA